MSDFEDFLAEQGLNQENLTDAEKWIGPLAEDNSKEKFHFIGTSEIQGKGVFANRFLPMGRAVGRLKIGSQWTEMGRYMNHSKESKISLVKSNGTIYVYVIEPIKEFDEITVNYRDVKRALQT